MRTRYLLAISLALVLGCQTGAPTRPTASPGRGRATVAPATKGLGLPAGTQTRLIDPTALDAGARKPVAVELIGKIRLLSDHGAAVVSNGGGGILSNNSGSLIGKIRSEGGNLIGKIRYTLGQAPVAPPGEDYLADARIEVLDAEGRVLVDKDGKPLGATSDKEGGYTLNATLPDESLILRVQLAEGGLLKGGQLLAMLARGGAQRALDIDTASSLGASYVLDKFVQRSQGVYDKLPAEEAQALQRDLEAARGHLEAVPSYQPADLVAAADRLRAAHPPVAQTLDRIRAVLLAGQENLGRGRPATEVSLGLPAGVLGDAAGNLFVVEVATFRIRRIAPDGRIYVHAGTGARKGAIADESLDAIGGAVLLDDGTMYVTQTFSNRLRRIAPDGSVTTVVSEGLRGPGPVIRLPDGSFVIGEASSAGGVIGRILSVVPGSPPVDLGYHAGDGTRISALARAADGTLYAVDCDRGAVVTRKPGGDWTVLVQGLSTDRTSGLVLTPDGGCYVSDTLAHRVMKIAADGTMARAVGTGTGGHEGEGGPARDARINNPGGLWLAPDGALYVTDADGLVQKVAADGTLTTIAGALQTKSGDALGVSINGPGGLAIDRLGRLMITEAASSTIKRLDAGRLDVVAGTSGLRGFTGDGGPASSARFANPAGLGFVGDDLYVVDAGNFAIRRIDAAGVVTTVVSNGHMAGSLQRGSHGPFPALAMPMDNPLMLAVSPKGQVYWTDPKANVVLRLAGDQVEIVAGTFETLGESGDGGPANQALLAAPTGMAFDRAGDLYVCDSGNLTVRKIVGGEPTGTITIAAGVSAIEAVGRFVAGAGHLDEEGHQATDTALAVPCTVAFDDQGGMIIAELGTSLAALGANPESAALMAQLPPIGARLRRVAPDGTIRTIAGEGTKLLADPSGDDTLIYPFGLAFDREGRLIIADAALNQVKMLPKGSF